MDNNNIHISIISPVYQAENLVDKLVERLILSVSKLTDNFEIILVEDCGPDNSWKKIQENCQKHSVVKGIKLSRNYGQQHAIQAGLDAATGEYVVTMDCDLQDQPEEIPKLLSEYNQGSNELVYGRRVDRKSPNSEKAGTSLYYKFSKFNKYKYNK